VTGGLYNVILVLRVRRHLNINSTVFGSCRHELDTSEKA